MNADTLRRLSGVSLATALRIVLALSCLSSLIQARPRVHHSEEESSSGESGDGDEASHDLIVKLLLDLVNVLPSDKLSELDAVLTRGMMEMPQADESSKDPEDEVDVQDQELKDKDPPPTPERDPYAREFLDPANSTAAPNVSVGYIEAPRLPDIRESDNDTLDIQRDKNVTLYSIKHKILGFFKMSGRNPGNWSDAKPQHKEMLNNVLKTIPVSGVEDATEKVQSYFPSCSVPTDTDEELWNNGKMMNLVFNVSFPPPAPPLNAINGTATLVTGAKLRLYFKANSSMTLSENCSQTANDDRKAIKFCSVRIGETAAGAAEDRQFRVSVHRYTKPLKKQEKTKRTISLLDSRMVTLGSETYAEFDVKKAARAWGKSKNFGLAVQVEDLAKTTLPADSYFVTMNCSKEARSAMPMPGFVLDATREASNSSWGTDFYPTMYPTLDVTTTEMSEEQQQKLSLEEALRKLNASGIAAVRSPSQASAGAASKRSGGPAISLYEQEKHKLRHQKQRKLIEAAATAETQPDASAPKPLHFPKFTS
nr:PREDICTED: uncharacterized protein LOC109032555 isoform X1 [Bemisia tabaci]